MKATLTFTLPEENVEFQMATNAARYASFIFAFEQYLRHATKYNEVAPNLAQIREQWFLLKQEEGLTDEY